MNKLFTRINPHVVGAGVIVVKNLSEAKTYVGILTDCMHADTGRGWEITG